LFIKGTQPYKFDGVSAIDTKYGSVICPVCEVVWSELVIQLTFTEEEKERFWAGKGCPDCKILTRY